MTRRYLGGLFVGGMVAFTLAVWNRLPERIPTHWNIRGEVDGWMGKWPGAFLMPMVALGLWLLLRLLPHLDPRRENYERFTDTYWTVVNVIMAYTACVHVLILGSAIGWPIDVSRAILVSVGVLLLALGNVMPRMKPNWWMGIRTPWTLENDKVWRDTHRLGGRLFVLAGLLTMLVGVLSPERGFWLMMVSIGLAAFVPLVYSYVLWRKEQN